MVCSLLSATSWALSFWSVCFWSHALPAESPLTFHLSSLELCKSSSPTFPNSAAVLKTRKPKPYDHVWLLISLVQITCVSYFLLSLGQNSNQNNLREAESILIDSFLGFNSSWQGRYGRATTWWWWEHVATAVHIQEADSKTGSGDCM